MVYFAFLDSLTPIHSVITDILRVRAKGVGLEDNRKTGLPGTGINLLSEASLGQRPNLVFSGGICMGLWRCSHLVSLSVGIWSPQQVDLG